MRTYLSCLSLTGALLGGSFVVTGEMLTVLYSFGAARLDGVDPMAGVVFGSNGKLYGTASVGGASGNGLVYELSPPATPGAPWTETIVKRFFGPNGSVPECRLVVAPGGRLFGTTLDGGANNAGTAFEMIPPAAPGDAWRERVLYSFGDFPGDGINPNQGLLATRGGFFGVTSTGGASNQGTVFALTPPDTPGDRWKEHILHSFTGGGDAAFPSSELMMDAQGNLYGTTTLGGTNNVGAVFQLRPPAQPGGAWVEAVVHSFADTDGSSPAGRLQLGPDGSLYGTTSGGGALFGGTVFQLTPPATTGGAWAHTVLYNFSGGTDGGGPTGGVAMDRGGKLYGTAAHGGRFTAGAVFELDPPATPGAPWTQTVLHSLQAAEGFAPQSLVTLANGGIYGTTSQGGAFGTGTVFLLTK